MIFVFPHDLSVPVEFLHETARTAADAALRRERERSARFDGGDLASPVRAQLELTTLQAQVAELELVQVDATRQQVSARLASLDEPVARLRNEVDRVRGQQRLDDADLQALVNRLVSVVQETTQPENVLVWLDPMAERRQTIPGAAPTPRASAGPHEAVRRWEASL